MDSTQSDHSSTSGTIQAKEGTQLNINDPSQLAKPDDDKKEGEQDSPVETPKKPFKFKVTVFMLCLISVVVAMDSVIVAASLPAMTVSLKGTSLEAFWVGTSYLLAQTVCDCHLQTFSSARELTKYR